ncbi:MAG TPA: hypothetical protein VMA33_02030 [Candidatus Tectomicrobia bacterium]|nr:hypothetical protein [Candidatus Tectomicrobia bacterium]
MNGALISRGNRFQAALSGQIALLKARLAADRANGGIFVHIVNPASTLRSSVRDDDMLLQQNLQ